MAKGIKGSKSPIENQSVRTSFILNPATVRKIKFIALNERREITSVVDEAFNEFIVKYEKKFGEIRLK